MLLRYAIIFAALNILKAQCYSVRQRSSDDGETEESSRQSSFPFQRLLVVGRQPNGNQRERVQNDQIQQQDAHQYLAALNQFHAAASQQQQQPYTAAVQQQTSPQLLQQNAYPTYQNFGLYNAAPPSSAGSNAAQYIMQNHLQSSSANQPNYYAAAATNAKQEASATQHQSLLGVSYSSAADVAKFQFSGNGVNYSF